MTVTSRTVVTLFRHADSIFDPNVKVPFVNAAKATEDFMSSSVESDFLSFSSGAHFFLLEKSSANLVCNAENCSTTEIGKIALSHLQLYKVETPRPVVVKKKKKKFFFFLHFFFTIFFFFY